MDTGDEKLCSYKKNFFLQCELWTTSFFYHLSRMVKTGT